MNREENSFTITLQKGGQKDQMEREEQTIICHPWQGDFINSIYK